MERQNQGKNSSVKLGSITHLFSRDINYFFMITCAFSVN